MRFVYTLFLCLLLLPSTGFAAKDIILVLDASGSMWGQIEGTAKISIARDVVDEMLVDWSHDNELGLIAYGHRREGDCNDIQVVLPVAPLDPDQFSIAVRGLQPKGKTPLSASIKIAAEQLNYIDQQATVILVSDGEETCGLNPCEVASELFNFGLDFTAHVVGFDVTEQSGLSQLQCIAANTGGSFYQAANAIELKQALVSTLESVDAPPEPDRPVTLSVTTRLTADAAELEGIEWIKIYPVNSGEEANTIGKPIEQQLGGAGETRFKLPPGDYLIEAMQDAVTVSQPITIKPGEARSVDIILNAAHLTLTALAVPDGKPVSVEWLKVYNLDNRSKSLLQALGSAGTADFLVPAGEYLVEASRGVVTANEIVKLPAGETLNKGLVLNSGVLNVSAVMAPGGSPVTVEWFYIYQLQPDGAEKQVTRVLGGSGTTQFTLGVGDYIVEAVSRGGTVRTRNTITIVADDTIDQTLNMNMGIVEIRTEKAGQITGVDWFYAHEVGAEDKVGPRLGSALGGSGTASFFLPAGKQYIGAKPRGPGQTQWLPVEITAGETTPTTIKLP